MPKKNSLDVGIEHLTAEINEAEGRLAGMEEAKQCLVDLRTEQLKIDTLKKGDKQDG